MARLLAAFSRRFEACLALGHQGLLQVLALQHIAEHPVATLKALATNCATNFLPNRDQVTKKAAQYGPNASATLIGLSPEDAVAASILDNSKFGRAMCKSGPLDLYRVKVNMHFFYKRRDLGAKNVAYL